MSCTRMITLHFLLWVLSPFVIFDSDNPLILCPLCNSKIPWKKCRTGPDDMSCTRMTTLSFLLLALSPFVIFDSDNPLISCPLCKSKTLWNSFMILSRNVKQKQMICRIQEWQLCLSYFWCYLPFLFMTMIIHWFACISTVTNHRPFIFGT